MKRKIYIVDDDIAVRKSLQSLLSGEGYEVAVFPEIRGFTNAIGADAVGVLLLDIAMPGEDGLAFLRRCREMYDGVGVIMITGEATIDRAVAATKLGAYDFLEKPLNPSRLLLSVKNLNEHISLTRQLADKERGEEVRYELIGTSQKMQDLRAVIRQVAAADSTVLITGENGTGKELVAWQIWSQSPRRKASYIKVNCAAIPTDLSEAELFGYRRGAFTGADHNRDGKFKAADGGTIFLDEIGDLSGAVQAKLLRILESGELEPLGADLPESVDARLIAATNRDLREQMENGKFREDLFYRLNVVPIAVPPLRERRDDIASLVTHFAGRLAVSTGLGKKTFTPEAIGYLSGLPFKGNVRELRNIVERCFIMSRADQIDPDELKLYLGSEYESPESENGARRNLLTSALRNFERSFLANELATAQGNISELARKLGIDRGNLSRKLKSYDLV